MKEKIEFKKIREFGDIINDTIHFIKQNFKPLLKAYLVLCGFFLIASALNSIFLQLQLKSIVQGGTRYEYTGGPFSLMRNFALNYLLMMVFVMLNYTAISLTVLAYIALYIRKGNVAPTLAEVWSYFKYYFFRMLGSGIVMTIFIMLSFLCCIVPGFYVLPAVFIFYAVLVFENAGFSFSFNRAFQLVKNEWWITFATILVVYFIYYACAMVIQVPAMVISLASSFTQHEGLVTGTYGAITSIAQQLSQVFMIIPLVASALIYFNLVERKESSGLMEKIDSFGEQKPADEHPFTPEEY